MKDQVPFELEDLLQLLPHRPPFLFVDRVTKLKPDKFILAERRLRQDEPQFIGHFPSRPIMPGVLVVEALAQTSGLLMGLSEYLASGVVPAKPKSLFLGATNIKFTHPAAPGDLLKLSAEGHQQFNSLFRFEVEATVGRNLVASGTLTLALVSGAY
jgi:3-hydroxymyristoyl/3-hydroxydecanoyl-(acyl carrier protein) dehydratase